MSDAAAGAGPSGWIEARRFPEWRALREWVAREAFALPADTPADTPATDPDAPPLRIVVPDSGAQWVLERMLRERLPAAGGGAFPRWASPKRSSAISPGSSTRPSASRRRWFGRC